MSIESRGENYLSTTETTDRLKISRSQLDRLVRDGKIKKYRQAVRQTPLYRERDVQRLLEVHEELA